ncbi:MAG: hypothetical protein ABI353_01090 [Isosphaeraceae bacterium]
MDRLRRGLLGLMVLAPGLGLIGCAHRRQVFYPNTNQPASGVHVRAPFVDIQMPTLGYRDRDRDRDDD